MDEQASVKKKIMNDQASAKERIDELYDTDPKYYLDSLSYDKLWEYTQCFIEKTLYGSTNGMFVYEEKGIERILYESAKKNVKVILYNSSGEEQDTPGPSTKELRELIKLHISKPQQEKAYFLVLNLLEDDVVSDACLVYLLYRKKRKIWKCCILPLVHHTKIDAEFKFLCSELKTVEVKLNNPELYNNSSVKRFTIETVVEFAKLRMAYLVVNEHNKEQYLWKRRSISLSKNVYKRRHQDIIFKKVTSNLQNETELKLSELKKMECKWLCLLYKDKTIGHEEIFIKGILTACTNMNMEVSLDYPKFFHETSHRDYLIEQVKLYLLERRSDPMWYLFANLDEEKLVDFAYLAYIHCSNNMPSCSFCYIMCLVNFRKADFECDYLRSKLEDEPILVSYRDNHDFGIKSLRIEQLIEYAKLRMQHEDINFDNMHQILLMLKNIINAKTGTYAKNHEDIFKKFTSED